MEAQIKGKKFYAGNEALFKEHGIGLSDELLSAANQEKSTGSTVIYLAQDQSAVGIIALSDTLRPDAPETIEAIRQTGIQTVLLTGDSLESASHMAQIAKITEIKAQCLPETKLQKIRDYQNKGELVCMVGDGINDAPALKAAYVSIAMGGIGSDIAIEAADIALVGDDIKEIVHLLKLSKMTMKTIRFNLIASMTLNFIAIALAITGFLNPVLGALIHNAGSVAVILLSSRLLHWRRKQSGGLHA